MEWRIIFLVGSWLIYPEHLTNPNTALSHHTIVTKQKTKGNLSDSDTFTFNSLLAEPPDPK